MSYKEEKQKLEEKYRDALQNFLTKLQEREDFSNEQDKKQFPNAKGATFQIEEGRKYDKVIRVFSGEMVYCFIDKSTGGIIKASTWKQPDKKKYERGNIFNDNPLKGTNLYGVDYLNLDNTPYKAKGFDN